MPTSPLTPAQYQILKSFHDDVEALLNQLDAIAQEPPSEVSADLADAVAAFRETHPCPNHISIFALVNPTP